MYGPFERFAPPQAVPPFRVQYFCPRQSRFWQGGGFAFWNYVDACMEAQILLPNSPDGHARVLDARNVVIYEI